jgi:hypothetical protein
MGITLVTAICALAASVFLLFDSQVRGYAIASLLVSGLQIAIAQGMARLHIVGLPLGKALPAILLVIGVLILFRAQTKSRVVAATILTMAGAIQLALILRLI